MDTNTVQDPIKDALISQQLQATGTAAVAEAKITAKPEKKDVTGKAQKEAIYANIEALLAAPKADGLKAGEYGRKVFDFVVAQIFSGVKASDNNYVRLNDGNGALAAKKYASVTRKLPNGEVRTFPESYRVRYIMGASISRLFDGTTVAAAPAPEPAAETAAVDTGAGVDQGAGATEVPETLDLE